jgi:hypothetical protein
MWVSRKPRNRVGNHYKPKFSFLNLKSNQFMKAAKIMLTSIAVLAVVGGALAFKAKSQSNIFCKIRPGQPTQICEQRLYKTTFQNNVATTNNPCPDETLMYTAAGCGADVSTTETTVYSVQNL